MARNPKAQRPRVPGWGRADRITVGVNLIERFALRQYAARHGLAVGAAARELISVALLLDAEANPTASDWNASLARVREEQALGRAEVAKIYAQLGVVTDPT